MTDSTERNRAATPEELAMLKNLPQKNSKDRTELSDLPGWAKVAIVYKELYNVPYQEALDKLGIDRSIRTLENYRKSPAGKKLRADTRKFHDDPVAMAEALIRSSAMAITVDRLLFLEMAKASGNFVEADKIARDLQDRVPELAKKSNTKGTTGGMVIHLTLRGDSESLEPVMVDSEHRLVGEVQDADFEIEDE